METGLQPAATEATTGGSKGTRIAFKVLSGLFAAAAFGGLFGVAVLFAWFDNEDGGIHRVHDMGFGALFGAILTVGLLVQNWRPERKVSAFYQTLDVAVAVLVASALATSGFAILGAFVLVGYGILFALHPYRSQLLHPVREGFSPALMVLTALGAVPLISFALTSARLQRNGLPIDPHVKNDHWTLMAAMAIGIVLVGFLSAFKFRGWRISAWSAGVAAFLYGLISVVYPHKAGSEGTGWGLIALFGGLVFIAAAEWEARRGAPAGTEEARGAARSRI
jgi:hypothetical protein